MIGVKELRIGNFALFNNEPVEINSVGKSWHTHIINCEYKSISRKTRIKEYYRIPLTEEWLIKFGFENKGTIEYPNYVKNILMCMVRKDRISISNLFGYISDLEYVHQLQNLYYGLTGKEL